jgi:hypothetical protein
MSQWQSLRQRVAQGPVVWLQEQSHQGEADLQAGHAQLLGGQGDPRLGHKLWLDMTPAR